MYYISGIDMLIKVVDSKLFWTVVGAIATVGGFILSVLTLWRNRQKKEESLKRAYNELCEAMSMGEINTLLNNVVIICNDRESNSDSLIELQNKLHFIIKGVNTKWNEMKLQLKTPKHLRLYDQLESIMTEYQFCIRDVETIISILRCKTIDHVDGCVSRDNSEEMIDIINATKPLDFGIYEFVSQIVALKFKDLEIPDYAAKMRLLLVDEQYDNLSFSTQLCAMIGDANAQYALCKYYSGQKQYVKAFAWCLKAAKQGLPIAQNYLGICYSLGEGVEKNEKEAFFWYQKSSEQGFAKSQNNLGLCYLNGEGVGKDKGEAFKWFKNSADQGFADGQLNLGLCYYFGDGVEKDDYEAFKWFKKSAERGCAVAQNNLGSCFINGEGVKKNEIEGFKWFKKSAEQSFAPGQKNLSMCYEIGKGVEKDEKEAFGWCKKSAEQGYADAQNSLGVFYSEGKGVEKNEEEAFEWYKKSAEQGCTPALLNIGNCYYLGIGCTQDFNKAYECFNKVIERNENVEMYRRALLRTGFMYEGGAIGFGSDFIAVDYFKTSAQYGDELAQLWLGYCYENGKGVKEIDIEKAKYWYRKAAEQNNKEAIVSLARLTAN